MALRSIELQQDHGLHRIVDLDGSCSDDSRASLTMRSASAELVHAA